MIMHAFMHEFMNDETFMHDFLHACMISYIITIHV